jgi:hypothetical protein
MMEWAEVRPGIWWVGFALFRNSSTVYSVADGYPIHHFDGLKDQSYLWHFLYFNHKPENRPNQQGVWSRLYSEGAR